MRLNCASVWFNRERCLSSFLGNPSNKEYDDLMSTDDVSDVKPNNIP